MNAILRFAGLLSIGLLCGCVSRVGVPEGGAPAPSAAVTFEVRQDVGFTPADWPQALTADVYVPAGAGPFPAVLMVHGGGWNGRTRADMDDLSAAAAARGYVVMNLSYRLAPQFHFPAQLQDLQQAVLWLRSHAADLKVRSDRIGAWGYSAGAHLVSLLAVTSPGDRFYLEGARIQALVSGGTPADLRIYPDGPLTNALMGVAVSQDPELWRNASPLALVTTDDPPAFLYHGTFDYTVSDSNAHTYYAALQAAGVPAELMLLHGREHLLTFVAAAPVEDGIAFLDRHLR